MGPFVILRESTLIITALGTLNVFPASQSTDPSIYVSESSADDKTRDEVPRIQSYLQGERSVVDLPWCKPRERERPVHFVGNNLEDYECPTCADLPTMERPYVWYKKGFLQKKHSLPLCVNDLVRNVRKNRVRKTDFPFFSLSQHSYIPCTMVSE
ncbi:unnamed protein product [Orchesella dallaii]|uniref:Uncharacterized protein n=1 Tax=Orchesella dallaii TaxID=48710 RepID=A0ABP1S7P5_9HEXA